MSERRDILVRLRQQAAVCKEQGYPETHDFLSEAADELEQTRMLLGAAERKLRRAGAETATPVTVNGHG